MDKWIKNAIFYEVYPTSYQDSNSDGIGDLKGIESRLEYIKDTGFNALWINPFFKSPFRDGGYDVSDFFDVDPRFGSLNDFKELLKKAHELDLRIIIDLIPGHSSEQNYIFQQSSKPQRNEYSDLFIWNNSVWDLEQPYRLISGRYDRNACYMVNFFSTQPAFNFGFNKITHPSWQMSYKDPRTYQARDYMIKILSFWLDLGVDGFRVDMADSLVKNDDDKLATMEVWEYIFKNIKTNYPNACFVSEWCNPNQALKCGFDVDFVLDHHDNFCHFLGRSSELTIGKCVLNGGEQESFKKDLVHRIKLSEENHGLLGLISGNHDCPRIATLLDLNKNKIFYMIHFTLPGVPFVYYGDEIGMKHCTLDSKDGGYQRTGDRTPMKWDNSLNKGFSSTSKELYLPLDSDPTNVEDSLKDPDSLLNFIKKVIKVRKDNQDELISYDFRLIEKGEGIIAYVRKNIKVVVNLSTKPCKIDDLNETLLLSNDNALVNNELAVDSAIIYR